MAFSISIGDALLLAQIAWTVGQAFTTGRHSAPAEFLEVQKLLYTLSKSLELLASCLPQDEPVASSILNEANKATKASSTAVKDADAILQHMILNCSSTLTHLKTLVEKYAELGPGQAKTGSGFRAWKAEMLKNWKKVVWTKEGGDITKLKGTLTAHITGLNTAVNAVGLALGKSTHAEVTQLNIQLNEKLDGLTDLLLKLQQENGQNTGRVTVEDVARYDIPDGELTFLLSVEGDATHNVNTLCPKASFSEGLLNGRESHGHTSNESIFTCRCASNGSGKEARHQRRLSFFLLPITLVVQVADPSLQQKYQLYVGSPISTSPVSLHIGQIPPKKLRQFENKITKLALSQAARSIRTRQDSMLISHITSGNDGGVVAVLNMIIGYSNIANDVLSFSITAGGRSFSPPPMRSLQVLHYKFTPDIGLKDASDKTKNERIVVHQSYAELLIRSKSSQFSSNDDLGTQTFTINIYHDTLLEFGSHSRELVLSNVQCMAQDGSSEDSKQTHIRDCTLSIEFRSTQAAGQFRDNLEAIKQQLFILYLQKPNFGDQVVYVHTVGDTSIYDYVFRDATLAVVRETQSDSNRLILLSSCHTVSVCLKLPAKQVEKIAKGAASLDDQFPAHFVRVGPDRTMVRKQAVSLHQLLGFREANFNMHSLPFKPGAAAINFE